MPRLKIIFPDQVLFTAELCVRVDDINYGGHLSNDAVLRLAHEARLLWLDSFGCMIHNALLLILVRYMFMYERTGLAF